MDLIIKNADVVIPHPQKGLKIENLDLGISQGKIQQIGNLSKTKSQIILNAKGLTILPGIIDSQVHFREPGLTHKEDIESGSRSALLGGVTSFFEMPNTKPSTISEALFNEKILIAQSKSYCHFGFYIGGSTENIAELKRLEKLPGCPGVKIFMGSSTGSLLVEDDPTLLKILKSTEKRIAVHSEDNSILNERKNKIVPGHPESHTIWRDVQSAYSATDRLLKLLKLTNRKAHVLHVSTAEEMKLLKTNKNYVTVEVLPQHLTLSSPECYLAWGTKAQQNPPIREKYHLEALWKAISDGTVDIIASDHAPHTLEEKSKLYPESPSGMPGVETLLPIMLNHVHNKKLSLEKLVMLMSQNPASIFKIKNKGQILPGFDADFSIVDLKVQTQLSKGHSKCGWSIFEGMKIVGFPKMTVILGQLVMQEGEILLPPQGQRLNFEN